MRRFVWTVVSALVASCGTSPSNTPSGPSGTEAGTDGEATDGDDGSTLGTPTPDAGSGADGSGGDATLGDATPPGDGASPGHDAGSGSDSAATDGGLVVPADASLGGVTAIAAGSEHTCALEGDGSVSCWGDDTFGELGVGAAVLRFGSDPQTYAVPVVGLSGATSISAGLGTTCAVLSNGTVMCLGAWVGPQVMSRSAAPRLVAGLSGAAEVSLGTATGFGQDSGCVLLASGAVDCLVQAIDPDSGYTDGLTVTAVSGLGTGVVALSSGSFFSCVALSGGAAKCWGDNTSYRLGNGSMSAGVFSTPQSVVGLTGVTSVAAGEEYACALLSGGTVYCWGNNTYGQLGNTSIALGTPNAVQVNGVTTATAITAGENFACALLSGGIVQCWGDNGAGQLGNGGAANMGIQFPSVTGITNAIAVAAGSVHACALLADHTVRCWGDNAQGQLGDGTTTTRTTPVLVR